MAKILLPVFFSFITQLCCAQQKKLDSLLNELKKHTQEDTVRLNLLNAVSFSYGSINPEEGLKRSDESIQLAQKLKSMVKLGQAFHSKAYNYMSTGQYDTSLKTFEKAVKIFEKEGYQKGMLSSLNNIGIIQIYTGDYTAALKTYFRNLGIAENLKDTSQMISAFGNMGIAFRYSSDYVDALTYDLKALAIVEKSNNKQYLLNLYGEAGLVYRELKEYDKAQEYYRKAIQLSLETGDKRSQSTILSALGQVYIDLSNYNKALEYLQQSLSISNEVAYVQNNMATLGSLGLAYYKLSDYSSALKYYQQALSLSEKLGDKGNTAVVLSEMGDMYANAPENALQQLSLQPREQYIKAIAYLNRSIDLAKEIGAPDREIEPLESLSKLYEKQKNFAKALDAYKQAVVLKNSSLNDKKKQEITRLEMQYDFDKKEALINASNDKKHALAAAEINKQKVIRNASIGIGGILMLAAITIFIFYTRRKDAIEKKKEAEFNTQVADTEMKALRAQMNPHFIYNSLNSINDYIDKHDTAKATLYTTKFAKLMRMILENSEQKEIPIADDLKALELYMQLEALRMNNKFDYQIDVDEDIDQENTLIPPLILQPFVENSIWHGISKKQDNGKIWIHIKKEGNMITCIVEDNGIGMHESANSRTEEDILHRKSLGMKITNARIDIINKLKKSRAVVTLSDLEGGTKIEVKLPEALAF
jgi:tetratricopeptide (TPR) repeat protein